MKALVAALVMAAGTAAAEGKDDQPRLGAHVAIPEVLAHFDARMDVAVRLVVDRSGEPADEVRTAVPLRFEADIVPEPGGKGGDVQLTCRIFIVRADGHQTPARDGPCYQGPVAAVEIGEPFRFRPGRDDPAGSAGILLVVRDEGTKMERRVLATYGWMPEE
ncbi:MAG: hypothetical protein ACT4OK_05640 [Gemmobacter sp.]